MTDKFGALDVPGTKHDNFSVLFHHRQQDWHLRMMLATEFFAGWSKCLSRKIGAVIVEDKTIISTGYNGPPRGVPECHTKQRIEQILSANPSLRHTPEGERLRLSDGTKCPRQILGYASGQGLDLCPAGHAEANAVANASRIGIRLTGADMYCWCPLPCQECSKMIIGSGLARVFYIATGIDYDPNSRWMLMNAGVSLIGITKELIEKYRQEQQ